MIACLQRKLRCQRDYQSLRVKTESFMKTFSQTQFDKTKSTFEKSN